MVVASASLHEGADLSVAILSHRITLTVKVDLLIDHIISFQLSSALIQTQWPRPSRVSLSTSA